jgi:hypothetical protein
MRRYIGMPTSLRMLAVSIVAWLALQAGVVHATAEQRPNGFALEGSSIPIDEIHRGGPPRDGIPALDSPKIVAASTAPWLDGERVIGVIVGDAARAYPLSVLVWHELVNDRLADTPVLVTYCPLCATGLVFDRRVDGRELTFGVSGLLYQSDLLMFDRQTDGLWSQISAHAVTGPLRDRRLTLLRSRITTWADWKHRHPATTALSSDTGHRRAYGRTPYMGYAESETLVFPAPLDRRYHPKMPTVGLRLTDGTARAYPARELERSGGDVAEQFAGRAIRVRYDSATKLFDVEAPPDVEVVEGFWFAWAAFHRDTTVFEAPPK